MLVAILKHHKALSHCICHHVFKVGWLLVSDPVLMMNYLVIRVGNLKETENNCLMHGADVSPAKSNFSLLLQLIYDQIYMCL